MVRPAAFVIMPFKDDLVAVYEQIIRPALDGYDVIRADTRLDERGILEKIITGIRDADLVIADITETNANVMYELGVAHSLGKPTIMIAQSVDRIPFDLRAYPVHEYSTHFARAADLGRRLRELGEKHRAGELLFANPVVDFIPTLRQETAAEAATGTYSFDESMLDIRAAGASIDTFVLDFGTAVDRFRLGIDEAFESPTEAAARRRKLADRMRGLALDLRELAASLHRAWERYGHATAWLVAPERLDQFDNNLRRHFVELAKVTDESLNDIVADIVVHRARINAMSRDDANMTHAIEEACDSMTHILNEIMIGKAHLARAIGAFVPRAL